MLMLSSNPAGNLWVHARVFLSLLWWKANKRPSIIKIVMKVQRTEQHLLDCRRIYLETLV